MALGRGLSALIPEKTEQAQEGSSQQEIDIQLIKDSRFQPRQNYAEPGLEELVASIKEKGILLPIVVRRVGEGFEVIAGERRLRAARKVGLKKVPVVVREASDQEAFILAIIENVQREDLNAVEKAKSYQRLVDEFNFSQEEIAKTVGKDRATISNLLRLLKLPDEIQKGLFENKISEGHARAILSVEDVNAQIVLYWEAVQKGLSVREVEARARLGAGASFKKSKNSKAKSKDPEVLRLEEELRGLLGTKVVVENSRKNKGRLIVEYYSLDDLDRILAVMRK